MTVRDMVHHCASQKLSYIVWRYDNRFTERSYRGWSALQDKRKPKVTYVNVDGKKAAYWEGMSLTDAKKLIRSFQRDANRYPECFSLAYNVESMPELEAYIKERIPEECIENDWE